MVKCLNYGVEKYKYPQNSIFTHRRKMEKTIMDERWRITLGTLTPQKFREYV